MPFKSTWEKTSHPTNLTQEVILEMVSLALPGQAVKSYKIISGGCANLNILIDAPESPKPLLLRIYLRDPDSSYREQSLALLIRPTVPIPSIDMISDCAGYRFAITEYLPGITLRQLLLGDFEYDLADVMNQVGQILVKIQSFSFSTAGFFDKDLLVVNPCDREDLFLFGQQCLEHHFVLSQLEPSLHKKISSYLNEYRLLLPDSDERQLVHADFDPANILVDYDLESKRWMLTGVLDWEFAFAGSMLWDVANILRDAHHMPSLYEEAFLEGIRHTGFCLTQEWRKITDLLNVMALLDSLSRSDPHKLPNKCRDVVSLLERIIE